MADYIDRDKLIEKIVNTPSIVCQLPQEVPFLTGSALRQNEIIDLIENEPIAIPLSDRKNLIAKAFDAIKRCSDRNDMESVAVLLKLCGYIAQIHGERVTLEFTPNKDREVKP